LREALVRAFTGLYRLLSLVILLQLLFAAPSFAARWQELGNAEASTDKIMLDLDSVQQLDAYRIVTLMTVYEAARTNIHGFKMDRHLQKTAIDCQRRAFSPIQVIGYLNGKQVGTGPETQDWRLKFVPFTLDAFSQRLLNATCAAPIALPGTQAISALPNTGANGAPGQSQAQGQGATKSSSGSGIVLNLGGDILTNGHVVRACKSIMVKPMNGEAVAGHVDTIDPKNDLAVVKTNLNIGIPVNFRLASKPARLGEDIGVIGYPLTGFLSAEPKATFGQINSVAGFNNDYTLLQISAPVQPGNSGGPVLDATGTMVGVVVSQASLAVIALAGNVPQNVNFAIRGEVAQIFLNAHGVKFFTADQQKKLANDELAALGQKSTVLILCLNN